MLVLPPRPKDVVPLVTDGPLAAVSFGWQLRPPQDTLVVAIRGIFSILPGAAVEPAGKPNLPLGDIHYDADRRASLRHGSDLSPFKPQADVTLVGHAYPGSGQTGITNVQLVFGKLRCALAAIGDRTWRQGAPTEPQRFERIPLRWERAFGGLGYDPNPVGRGIEGAVLPNLEDPQGLIRSPGDRPAPRCFAPVPRTWPGRSAKLGSYDSSWLKDQWPYFPKDFDWRYCNAAPAEQQIPYPRGDEAFDLAGVHPDHPVVSGKLAGLQARAFAQLTPEAGGKLREIPVHLDTIAFDADALEVSLVWRGLIDVTAEHAPEIDRLFVCADSIDAPMSSDAARDRFLARLVALHGPQVLGGGDEPSPADAGMPPSAGSTATEAGDGAAPPAAGDASETPPPPAPVLSREEALALIAAGASLEGLSFAGCDLANVDFAGRSLAGALFTDATLDGAHFAKADLSGAVLVRAKASGATFEGARLVGANLSDAVLTSTDFEGANLEGASLADVQGLGARFAAATLSRAKLTDAQLDGACFDSASAAQADFSGAKLTGASFRGASLDDAQLYDCAAEGACFDSASLVGMRADAAQLAGASFVEAKASEASFEAANLEEARFVQADLSRAVLSHAQLGRATLTRVTACGARFRRACLVGAQASKANLMQANFEGADLSGADLRGANLYGVETWKATLIGTQLDQALVAGSKLTP